DDQHGIDDIVNVRSRRGGAALRAQGAVALLHVDRFPVREHVAQDAAGGGAGDRDQDPEDLHSMPFPTSRQTSTFESRIRSRSFTSAIGAQASWPWRTLHWPSSSYFSVLALTSVRAQSLPRTKNFPSASRIGSYWPKRFCLPLSQMILPLSYGFMQTSCCLRPPEESGSSAYTCLL